MIVTVLRGLVAPVTALMIVTTRLVVVPHRLVVVPRLVVTPRRLVVVPRLVVTPRRLVVMPRLVVTLRCLVVAVLSLLVAVLILSVLRANRQWNQGGERERRHRKNGRLPMLLTHGDCPSVVWLERV
jgi:hypothetical protein